MERNLSHGWMLSLKEISHRKVVVILMSQRDILASIYTFDVEQKIEDNMSKLNLPPLLTKELMHLVTPIGTEIRNWNEFRQQFLKKSPILPSLIHFDVHILERLRWTVFGAIDYSKSAEALIRDEMLDIVESYRLACFYCLDDYIPALWEKLPSEGKKYFYEEGQFKYFLPPLEFCWPFIIKGEKTKFDNFVARSFRRQTSFNQCEFEESAAVGNKAAAEYFFERLTHAEKECSLLKATKAVLDSRTEYRGVHDFLFFESDEDIHVKKYSTVYYFLSLMNHEQKMQLFKKNSCGVLICLLDWPWQDLFLDIAEFVWPFLTAVDYFYLLNRIAYKIKIGYCLTKLFQKFFLFGSRDFKKRFVDQECKSSYCLVTFSSYKGFDTMKLIFRNVDSEDKNRLISSWEFLSMFYNAMKDGDQRWIHLCLQEAELSKEHKGALKNSFFKFLNSKRPDRINSTEHMLKQFCDLVDETEDARTKRIKVE